MRVIGYARVSTERQAEEGLGLEVQEAAIRAWARAHHHRLIGIVRDEGVSGTLEAEEREGLTEALNAAAEGRADALVVLRLDRLARSLTVQEAALVQAWRAGARVFTTESGEVLADDPEDPMRTFVRQVMGAAAQLDRAMIASRLRAGRKLKAERGGFAYGAPRYGTRAEDGELVAEPAEAEAVAYARKLRRKGESLRGICAALSEAGHRPKRGGTWHPAVVARILARS